jgi:regulator of replication initiation timing
MTVLDLSGGTVSAVSYDSTKPLEQLLQEATIRIPESGSLTALLGQIKGARVRVRVGGKESAEGVIVGLESLPVVEGKASVVRPFLSLLVGGTLRTFDILEIGELEFLDEAVRKDLEFYLATVLSSYKKDSKRMSILTAGEGERELFVSYVLEAPVWKTSYRIMMEENEKPLLQGWALVDNTGDEDWVEVDLALIAGLPVSFVHDLYNPRYMRRPVVEVRTESAAAPVIPEEAYEEAAAGGAIEKGGIAIGAASAGPGAAASRSAVTSAGRVKGERMREVAERSVAVKTLTREVGELFEYRVDHPVTVHRNQSALVPILQRPFEGRRVLLYNRATREKNPMACLELTNTTGLTLEGGPVTVMEADTYVGEAMLDTMKPEDKRFVPYAVELSCTVSVDDRSENGPVFRSVVSGGKLTAELYHLRHTKYVVHNKAKRPATLFLEHPRTQWELQSPQDPAETTDGFWRFKLELAAGARQELTVTERLRGMQQHTFDSLNSVDEVSYFIKARYIDEQIAAALREIIAMKERVSEMMRGEKRLTDERTQLFKDQERIRANIESLKNGTAERELAQRFVVKLGEQETRLDQIGAELEKLSQERKNANTELIRRIQSLSYTAELGS